MGGKIGKGIFTWREKNRGKVIIIQLATFFKLAYSVHVYSPHSTSNVGDTVGTLGHWRRVRVTNLYKQVSLVLPSQSVNLPVVHHNFDDESSKTNKVLVKRSTNRNHNGETRSIMKSTPPRC